MASPGDGQEGEGDDDSGTDDTEMDDEGDAAIAVHHDDPRCQRVGFAKIEHRIRNAEEGTDTEAATIYVRKYTVTMGRCSKSYSNDVELGDSMNISRQHAEVSYNFEKQTWELRVIGKNGLFLNRSPVGLNSPPQQLRSGDVINIAAHTLTWTAATPLV